MELEIVGRNYEVNDRTRSLIESKLRKIEKFLDDIIEIRCVLHVEKHRNICEAMVIGRGPDLKSVQEADNMEDAITSTIDHIKTQAQKNRKKIRDHHRKEGALASPDNWQEVVLEPKKKSSRSASAAEAVRPQIIRTTRLPIRPMSIEQAALMLDDSKNEFIVFKDVDTGKVSVIYRRRDANFGLISPE